MGSIPWVKIYTIASSSNWYSGEGGSCSSSASLHLFALSSLSPLSRMSNSVPHHPI